jgi:hypothetical protein
LYSTNDVLDFEVEASDTQFAASPASRAAFETLFNGDRWMIYRNSLTGVNHWDFVRLKCPLMLPDDWTE